MSEGAIEFRTLKVGRLVRIEEGFVDSIQEAKDLASALLVAVGKRIDEVKWFWGVEEWRAFRAPGKMVGFEYRILET